MRLNLTRKLFGSCEVIIKKVNPLYYEYLDEETIDSYNWHCEYGKERNRKIYKIYKITEILPDCDKTLFWIDTSMIHIIYRLFVRHY